MMSKAKKENKSKNKRRNAIQGGHSFWSGTLVFGMVNIPVELYPAQKSSAVRMRLLAPDGTPVSRRFYCPQHKRDVHPEHLVRAFQLEDGEYVLIRDEELEAASPKKSREIDLRQFVEIRQVPQRLFERSYFLTPTGDSNKAYRLLAGAMEKTKLAGIATFVMRGHEYLVAILSELGILRAQTLRFIDEVRSPQDVGLPETANGDAKTIREFSKVIERLSQATLSGLELRDTHTADVEELVKQKKAAGEEIVHVKDLEADSDEDADPTRSNTSGNDLLETIRRSLNGSHSSSINGQRRSSREKSDSKSRLSKLTKRELYEQAQRLKIEGRSDMTKDMLIAAIEISTTERR